MRIPPYAARIGTALGLVLTAMGGVAYDMGTIAVWIPPSWKVTAFVVGLFVMVFAHLFPRHDVPKHDDSPVPAPPPSSLSVPPVVINIRYRDD